ncbi:hypothetical protein [Paenibacillus sp. MBLB4367]|uniref:hypothetical protein n=1 Tax=Paenibacillus sp. MBLB4367 TaxID=3384767 RepID=UPI00390811B6
MKHLTLVEHGRSRAFVSVSSLEDGGLWSWIDLEVAAADRKLLHDWERAATLTGWYDYIYGNPYMVPRMYLHQAADNYRYALEHGVAVQYAELYPNWGEGPKP